MFYCFDLGLKNDLVWQVPSQGSSVPLAMISDSLKLLIAYDSNKILAYDTQAFELHSWSKANIDKFPKNFLNRFNRIIGLTQINEDKFIAYTNYTYITLNLKERIPDREVDIL